MHQRRRRVPVRKRPKPRRQTVVYGCAATKPTSLLLRFCTKVRLPLTSEGIPCDDPKPCWEWNAYVGKNNGYGVGYGQIRGEYDEEQKKPGKLLKAHVASYLLFHGPIPRGWDVCHACDNTICVNPHHLFVAPHKVNMHDYIMKFGRLGRPKSEITVDQLHLFREQGHEPFLSETWHPDEYEQGPQGSDPAAEVDRAIREGEVPF